MLSMSDMQSVLEGSEIAGVLHVDGPAGEARDRLVEDAHALAHLLHAAQVAVVAVAVLADGDLEVVRLVVVVRPVLADVVVDARRAQVRPGEARS
jgi:hypothetical protein